MKSCFFISPIGNADSPQRRRSDTVLKHIIEPVCKELEFQVTRVDRLNSVDKIDNTIIDYLKNSDLVIADMTEHNPNVFYEIGFRHSLEKPLIPIKEEETNIPFDLANLRTITYVTNDLDKADSARIRLRETILSFGIQEKDEDCQTGKTNTENIQLNVLPYLLNIQDSLTELKFLVEERNTDLAAQTIDLAMGQIQKNSFRPEEKVMEILLSSAMKSPGDFEQFMKLAEKFQPNK